MYGTWQKQANAKTSSHKYSSPPEESGSGFRMEPPRGARQNGYAHSSSMVHPSVGGSSSNKTADNSVRKKPELGTQRSLLPRAPAESSVISSATKNEILPAKESEMVNIIKKKEKKKILLAFPTWFS